MTDSESRPGAAPDRNVIDPPLRDLSGWIQTPELVSTFARVPEGLRGWQRLVDGIVAAIGAELWEVIALRSAAVAGTPYETTHPTRALRERLDVIRPALSAPAIDASRLTLRLWLAARLAESVARHDVSASLFEELRQEFDVPTLVGLCMAASVNHVSHLVAGVARAADSAAHP